MTTTQQTTLPNGFTEHLENDTGELLAYDGPKMYLNSSVEIQPSYVPGEGFHYYIDQRGDEQFSLDDVRALIPVLQQLVRDAETFERYQ